MNQDRTASYPTTPLSLDRNAARNLRTHFHKYCGEFQPVSYLYLLRVLRDLRGVLPLLFTRKYTKSTKSRNLEYVIVLSEPYN